MAKVMALRDAVSQYVRDGAVIAMGTGLESCIPFAAGHEIIRQGRRELTLVGPISDILFDQLIGAGCVGRVIAAWVGNVGSGIAYNFRRAVEEQIPRPLAIEDHSNMTVALALDAAGRGVPFLPSRTALGSDIARGHGRLRETTCPFTGERLLAVAALEPDLAILHVPRCDADGYAHLWGNLGVTLEAARAARHVLLTCEELVDEDVIRSDPNRTLIPGFLVAAVSVVPAGSHPSPTQGYVNRDDRFYDEYHAETKTRDGFLGWLERMVTGVPDHQAYLARLGAARVEGLRPRSPRPAAPANYGL
ncbi:MAG TPA: CoA-transferase [bacterium]|nr:CoA-transferase [bacterium]